eukprot:1064307-Prymnesium_polylepis.1
MQASRHIIPRGEGRTAVPSVSAAQSMFDTWARVHAGTVRTASPRGESRRRGGSARANASEGGGGREYSVHIGRGVSEWRHPA